jgi:hypothetical protein
MKSDHLRARVSAERKGRSKNVSEMGKAGTEKGWDGERGEKI